jgi:hypothetical protein
MRALFELIQTPEVGSIFFLTLHGAAVKIYC